MGNLTTPKQIPPWVTTPLLSLSLKPQELDKHRAWIAVKSEAALHGYWKQEPSQMVKAEMLRDWQDGLQDFHVDEIREAFRAHLASNPKIRPNVGYIRAQVMQQRGRYTRPPELVPDATPEPSPEQKARAAKIISDAGYGRGKL